MPTLRGPSKLGAQAAVALLRGSSLRRGIESSRRSQLATASRTELLLLPNRPGVVGALEGKLSELHALNEKRDENLGSGLSRF
jgi:hypothetical protein